MKVQIRNKQWHRFASKSLVFSLGCLLVPQTPNMICLPALPPLTKAMEKDKLYSKRYKEEEHVNGFELQRLCKS